ncbi:helix-turn-helix domain-containing protein [Burkholderia sp. 9775_39]|uniref:helix-turn-helix domain-containing protein n=1 Tax=Burkholderia TaxID=32008 RepID=UPI0018C3F2DC|nr:MULTISPECIES: helix-turn-helix domain-containing protein [Burkholderia]MBG0879400.1 helix-turn-helix domain-containing protein [Burkholderia sp. 9775_39]MBG0884541.1 helix-turn-helix domain-containing protein [Burkholderia sp. 9773_38]
MSFHLSNQAWDVELRSNQKIVLLALAHLAKQSTGECAPTVRKLAYMCGLSDSGVRDQLTLLIEAGRLELIDGDNGPRYRITVGPLK